MATEDRLNVVPPVVVEDLAACKEETGNRHVSNSDTEQNREVSVKPGSTTQGNRCVRYKRLLDDFSEEREFGVKRMQPRIRRWSNCGGG
jgi:hypothetical protein